MKTQNQAILEDLQKFLKKKGLWSEVTRDQRIEVYFDINNPLTAVTAVCFIFFIDRTFVYADTVEQESVVSLADPQYREKFLEHCFKQRDNEDKHRFIYVYDYQYRRTLENRREKIEK